MRVTESENVRDFADLSVDLFPCIFTQQSSSVPGLSQGYLGQPRQDLLTLNLNDED